MWKAICCILISLDIAIAFAQVARGNYDHGLFAMCAALLLTVTLSWSK